MSSFPTLGDLLTTGIWDINEKIQSKHLLSLANTLPKLIEASHADSTNSKYETGWRRWIQWCKENSESTIPLPANPYFVALFLNQIFQDQTTKGALTSAYYGIRWGHLISGFDSPTDHPFVKLAFEGARRLASRFSAPKTPKEPLPVDLLKSFYHFVSENENTLPGWRFLVMYYFAFAGFFRIEELVFTTQKC